MVATGIAQPTSTKIRNSRSSNIGAAHVKTTNGLVMVVNWACAIVLIEHPVEGLRITAFASIGSLIIPVCIIGSNRLGLLKPTAAASYHFCACSIAESDVGTRR